MDYELTNNTYSKVVKDNIRFSNWFDFTTIKEAMINAMLPTLRKKIKILNSIVGFNLIDVVDYFGFSEIATKMFFNYKSVFGNIPLFILKGMVWTFNKSITFAAKFYPTIPMVMIFTRIVTAFSLIPRSITFFEFTHSLSIADNDLIVKPIQQGVI
jgi:hypothetical protein